MSLAKSNVMKFVQNWGRKWEKLGDEEKRYKAIMKKRQGGPEIGHVGRTQRGKEAFAVISKVGQQKLVALRV